MSPIEVILILCLWVCVFAALFDSERKSGLFLLVGVLIASALWLIWLTL